MNTIELQDLPATLTVEETAKVLGIGRSSAYDAVTRGEIPALRIGNRLVVPTPKLLEMLGLPNALAEVEVPGDGPAT